MAGSRVQPLPKLVAFDLDGTLWWPEMYMLDGGAPFRRDKQGRVYDKRGEEIQLMGDSAAILEELATDPKWRGTEVAYVSRTEYPEWAIPCLKAFIVADSTTAFDISHHQEIYPGSKRTHFRRIHERTGIPYHEMVFYDNERGNCSECAPLGITCVYTPKGMTSKMWREGLQAYAESRSKTQEVDASR